LIVAIIKKKHKKQRYNKAFKKYLITDCTIKMKIILIFLPLLIFFGRLTPMNGDAHQLKTYSPNLYAILGVTSSASQEQIEHTYRSKTHKTEPILIAYCLLREPKTRNKYDQEGASAAAELYNDITNKRKEIIQQEQQKLQNLLDDTSKTQQKITKKIITKNSKYLRLQAKRKDPFYHSFLNDAINTNIYRLTTYLYNHKDYAEAYSILTKHIIIASKNNALLKEMKQLKKLSHKMHLQQSTIAF